MNVYGWAIYPVLEKKLALEIATILYNEVLQTTFVPSGEYDNVVACPTPDQLLVNPTLRKQYLRNPSCVWRNNNSRNPIVSKSCGMANIYHNPQVRDHILFNPIIYDIIHQAYQHLLPENKDLKLVYAKGPERVGIKPKGASDMERHMDTTFILPHQHRVQAFVTLNIDEHKDVNVGSIEVLSNFHHYFAYYPIFLKYHPQYIGVTATSVKYPLNLDTQFMQSLPVFETWLQTTFYSSNISTEWSQFIQSNPIPLMYLTIHWIQPKLTIGDLFIFDARCPHRNTKNTSHIPRIVAYVSLYPVEFWDAILCPSIIDMFTGNPVSKGMEVNSIHRDNPEEREYFKDSWTQRTTINYDNYNIRQVLGL